MPTAKIATTDLETLLELNLDYVGAVQSGNVGRFEEILAKDFCCSNPDGTLVDREGFLCQTAKPVTITELRAHDVLVRQLGEVAIIHARTTYLSSEGRQAGGRYTDVWMRHAGTWKAVSAHVTRC
jgi:ketosteroid isomerase-like protein